MDLMDLFIKIEVKDNATEHVKKASEAARSGTSAFENFAHVLGAGIQKAADLCEAALEKAAKAAISLAKYSLDAGMSFEEQMSKVEAIAGLTAEEMEAITDKAKEMGVKTKYSATEAGEAMYYMAQAGWNASQIIGGIEGVMDLAAASGENLASVSDIVTDALTAFGLAASDSAHFADVLAVAAAETNTDIAKLGQTFKYVAPIAGTLGYSIEDVAVAAGLMANSGIKASQAGTSLRSVLSRLASPTEQVKTAMEDIGISLTNSDGSSKSLAELMENLRDAFSGLSESEQVAYASTIAAKTGMSGFLAIVNASDADFDSLTESINNASGAADKMAATMQDNLAGKVEILKSSMEGFGLAVYEYMSLPLSRLAETGTKAVDSLTYALDDGGLLGVVSRASEMMQSFASVLVDRFPAATEAASSASEAFRIAIDGIVASVAIIAPAIVQGMQSAADTISVKVPEIMNGIAQKVKDNGQSVISAALGIVFTLGSAMLASSPALVETGAELLVQTVRGIEENLPKVTDVALSVLNMFAESTRNPENMHQLIDSAIAILEKLGVFIAESLPMLAEVAMNIIQGLILYIIDPNNLARISEAAFTIVTSFQQALLNLIGKIAEVGTSFARKFIDTFKGADWKGAGSQVVNAFLGGLQETWQTLVAWIEQSIGFVLGQIKNAISAVQGMIESLKASRAQADAISQDIQGKVYEAQKSLEQIGTATEGTTVDGDVTLPHGTGTGGTNVSVTQNIYSEAQTAADLMQAAAYEAEKAVIFA